MSLTTWTPEPDYHAPDKLVYWLGGQAPGCLDTSPRKVRSTYGLRRIGGLDRVAVKRTDSGGWGAVFYGWGGPTYEFAKARTLAETKALAETWVSNP